MAKDSEDGRDDLGRFAQGNKFASGNAFFESPEALQKIAEEYLKTTKVKSSGVYKPTITGLAYHLGFESLQSFYDYEKKEPFTYTIRRLRMFVQSCYEQQLYSFAWAGGFAALKNIGRSDWKDEATQIQIQEKVNADFGKTGEDKK